MYYLTSMPSTPRKRKEQGEEKKKRKKEKKVEKWKTGLVEFCRSHPSQNVLWPTGRSSLSFLSLFSLSLSLSHMHTHRHAHTHTHTHTYTHTHTHTHTHVHKTLVYHQTPMVLTHETPTSKTLRFCRSLYHNYKHCLARSMRHTVLSVMYITKTCAGVDQNQYNSLIHCKISADISKQNPLFKVLFWSL